MENSIIIGILLVIAVIALRSAVKHFKGQSGCCGGGSDYKPRKKRLKRVMATKIFYVDGMHCEKCANRVTEVVNDIPQVAGIVDLKKGIVTVSYEAEVPDSVIQSKIERVGYTVTGIE